MSDQLQMTPADIKAIRGRQGMTQKEFAKRIGVSKTTLAFWEIGHRFPSQLEIANMRLLDQTGETAVDKVSAR